MTRPTGPRSFRHLFGPVPSRRLGRSLGIDLVPHKVCTLDCRYCECGATTELTVERDEWVPTAEVLVELEGWLADHVDGGRQAADYLTFSGAGEPTLHRDLGRIIHWLQPRTPVPLALLTNGTLLGDPALRRELAPLDLVCPSLDTAVEATFQALNRPHGSLSAAALVDALVAFRQEFPGQIWLEVLLADGVNDSDAELDALAAAIERIAPDRVQLNTAVRPGADPTLTAAAAQTLARALARFGPRAEAVATFTARHDGPATLAPEVLADAVLAVVRRRPETVDALASSLGVALAEAQACVARLEAAGAVRREDRAGTPYVIAVERA